MTPGSDSPPTRRRRLARRLQQVSLRTKIVVPMVLLAIGGAAFVGIVVLMGMRDTLRSHAVARAEFDTAVRAGAVAAFMRSVQADLRFLAGLPVLRELASHAAARDPDRVRALRASAEHQLLVFAQGKAACHQVRLLDADGMELVRLNFRDGAPYAVPAEELQNKRDRYYVREALQIGVGAIYVSPLDLNVEHGVVEQPVRSVVRYATRVPGSAERHHGLVVINVRGNHFQSLIGPLPPGAEAWLVNTSGQYLGYVGGSAAGRRAYSVASQRHLDADFTPAQVAAILGSERGGLAAETDAALLVAAPVVLAEGIGARRWTLLWAHPRSGLEAPIRSLTGYLVGVMVLVVTVAAVIGLLVGRYLALPVEHLRRVTREIAAGNLDKRVDIATGDEIEGLADDFNAMTERVRDAQDSLAAWNERLEQAVVRRTAQVRQMQSGLARADKLASIGQMTAGIMHEVGNPLAAMKTNIQVAQRGSDACHACAGLLTEVLAEVDRLTTFLRSFSRLARLRSPAFAKLSVADVAYGVRDLVERQIQRRGVTLEVHCPPDVPTVRGDPDQLRQVLINLVLNAAEASPVGGTVTVRAASATAPDGGPGAAVSIVDHGAGMTAETLRQIWDPFFTTKDEGTGLGLAVCRQIVREHGGRITVASQPGEQTTVTVTLRAWQAPAEHAPLAAESEATT